MTPTSRKGRSAMGAKRQREKDSGRGEILRYANGIVLIGLNVIAETLDRGVEEFYGEDEKQARDERDPGPQVPRDNKRQRQREAGDGELLLDGGLGAETLPDAADGVPERSRDAGNAAATRKGQLGSRMARVTIRGLLPCSLYIHCVGLPSNRSR